MEETPQRLQMDRPCAECPWRRDAQPGKFPRRRYIELRTTCMPHQLPGRMFACHMSRESDEVACAGMLLVVGHEVNTVRLMVILGKIDPSRVSSDVQLYGSFDEMATANGLPLPPTQDRRGRR